MLKIKIISVGKIKENSLKELINEYVKRLSRHLKVNMVEVCDLPIKENASFSETEKILFAEEREILKHINEKSFLVSLCIEGEKYDSLGFAKLIDKLTNTYSEITFVIGSSHGLSKGIKEKSNLLLSMSDMTFAHNLAKLMIIEQIYRGIKIIKNEPYHK